MSPKELVLSIYPGSYCKRSPSWIPNKEYWFIHEKKMDEDEEFYNNLMVSTVSEASAWKELAELLQRRMLEKLEE